jgi:hypothetical protein
VTSARVSLASCSTSHLCYDCEAREEQEQWDNWQYMLDELDREWFDYEDQSPSPWLIRLGDHAWQIVNRLWQRGRVRV